MDQYAKFPIPYEGENYTIVPYDKEYWGDYEGEDELCSRPDSDYEEYEYKEKSKEEQDLERAGENIADNGGVRAGYLAFQALQEDSKYQCVPDLPFSANQLFWVRLIYTLIKLYQTRN